MRYGWIFAAMLIAGPAIGQTWTARTGDSTALLYASAFAPGGTTSFDCTTPSPQGVPLIETGDHETTRTDTPYDMIVSFSTDLIDPFVVPNELHAVRIILDGVAYPLPMVEYQDFYGAWHAWLPMTDDLFVGLTLAREMVVDTGTGVAYSYPTDGLRTAFLTAASHCIRGWETQGQRTPGGLEFWRDGPDRAAPDPIGAPLVATAPAGAAQAGDAVIRSTSLPEGYRMAPLLPLPDLAPDAILAHLSGQCSAGYDIDTGHVQSADIDGDGAPDFVLNWAGMQCGSVEFGEVGCGAGNCLIDVFLSARGYAPPEQMLGAMADVVLDAQGGVGLLLSGTPFVCADGFCDSPFYWNGSTLTQ